MTILGISCFYHDSAACLIKDGEIVAAAAEERFSRKKHDNGFPAGAIEFCIKKAGIAANEINIVAFYEKPIVKFERVFSQHLEHFPKGVKAFSESMGSWFTEKLRIKKLIREEIKYHGEIVFIPHHLTHAASSYFLSGFEEAAIVTIDGVGEWATTTIGFGKDGAVTIGKEIRFPHSIGLFYSTMTAFLGFKVNNDEYKVMGLAAYGDEERYKDEVDQLIKTYPDGSFSLNMDYFDYAWGVRMPSKRMSELFNFPQRIPEAKIHQEHKDLAASIQAKLEDLVLNVINVVQKKYKTDNLCIAGGVALNSVMNGKIIKKTKFKNIYIPPDPGDGGGAMGAALYINATRFNTNVNSFNPFLGPEYFWFEVELALKKKGLKYKLYNTNTKLIEETVKLLEKRKVIGWFQGRMEWGPRALGARSILADASDAKMKDIINAKVKKRESFRPFAPVILDSKVKEYFKDYSKGIEPLGDYMLVVLPFKKKGKQYAPATVHVNDTGRLQSIKRKDNPLYYDLLKAYEKKTGSPILINTSFNVRGEPIVCTPEDAVNCFLGTNIDALVIDNYIVIKNEV